MRLRDRWRKMSFRLRATRSTRRRWPSVSGTFRTPTSRAPKRSGYCAPGGGSNQALVAVGLLAGLSALFSAIFMGLSYQLADKNAEHTSEQANKLIAAVQEMVNQAESSARAGIAAQERIARESREQTERLTARTVDAALQATALAKEANELTASAARLDRRPWLGIAGFSLLARPPNSTTEAWQLREPLEGDEFLIRLSVINSGRTPALAVRAAVTPPYFGVSQNLPEWEGAQLSRGPMIVFPNETEKYFLFGPSPLNEDVAVLYRGGRVRLFVHIRAYYCDTEGRRHWSEVCAAHAFGPDRDVGEMVFCGASVSPGTGEHHPACVNPQDSQ